MEAGDMRSNWAGETHQSVVGPPLTSLSPLACLHNNIRIFVNKTILGNLGIICRIVNKEQTLILFCFIKYYNKYIYNNIISGLFL